MRTSCGQLFCGCAPHSFESEVVAEVFQSLEERMTYDQLFRISEPKRVTRSATVRGPPMQIDGYNDVEYHTFNFKAYPSTTGLRHRGYIKFHKPRSGVDKPMDQLEVEVDCECPDMKYRWAWANKQRGSGRVGNRSLNKSNGRAPVKTNPTGTPGLCKHLLAARNYIYGQISKFPVKTGGDLSIALDKLIKHADTRWIDYEGEMVKGRERERKYKAASGARNTWGPTGKPPKSRPKSRPKTPPEMQKPPELPPDDETPPEKGKFVSPKKPLPPGKPGAGKKSPTPPVPPKKPGQSGDDKKREESLVFSATNCMKNQTLLEARRVICEVASSMRRRKPGGAPPSDGSADGFDIDSALDGGGAPDGGDGFGDPAGAEGDLGAEGDPGAPGMDGPPDDFPPMDLDGPTGAPSAAPPPAEDEALGLLRSIAAGIGRLADEIAPTEDAGAKKGGKGDKPKPPAVPKVGADEDDEKDEKPGAGKGEEGTDDDDGPSDIEAASSKKSKMPRVAGV